MAIAALVTWIVTAGFGFFMLGTWLAGGGTRAGTATHFRPPVVFGHFTLAAAGLVVWIFYVVNDNATLAWIAFADLLVVAVLGDVLVLRWGRDRRVAGSAPTGGVSTTAARPAGRELAEQRIPTVAVVLHGVFALTTVVLVLLSALGVGG